MSGNHTEQNGPDQPSGQAFTAAKRLADALEGEQSGQEYTVVSPAKLNFEESQDRFAEFVAARRSIGEASPTLKLPDELLPAFIPRRVFELATNPNNLSMILAATHSDDHADSLRLLVAETDYPAELSNPEAYQDWKNAKALVSQSPSRVKVYPPAPESISRLHAEFSDLVDSGQLALTDRVLFEVSLRQDMAAPESLYVAHFDGMTDTGIATDFYGNHLPEVARALGFRYITGMNNPNNIDFFTEKLGRTPASSLAPDRFSEIFPHADRSTPNLTVEFLYPEDMQDALAI